MILFVLVGTAFVAVHTGLILLIAAKAERFRSIPGPPPPGDLPRMAVVVAARDEERDLPRCLEALRRQDYPVDLLEIFVADDHSTDRTAEIVSQAQATSRAAGLAAVRYVPVPASSGSLRGKANALHAAMEASDQPIVLITDADCAPPPGWARNHAAYFRNESVGIVCGEARVASGSLFDFVQALDWNYLLTSASVLCESGRPVTAMGNNMGLRRSAYQAVGGYPALPFSVTEDFTLFQQVARHTTFRVRFPLDERLHTVTLPLPRFRDIYRQRRRWALGGLSAPKWLFALYTIRFLSHLLPLVGLFIAPMWALAMLGSKALGDLVLLWGGQPTGSRGRLLTAFLPFQLYLFAYTISLPLALMLFRRIEWKGRTL